MSETLDKHIAAYKNDFEYAFDNEIILNWYPRRIMTLTNSESSVLELGIGHGHSCNHFSDFYAQYSVIDGSRLIIERFEQQYPKSKARLKQAFFEEYDTDEKFDVIIMGFILEHVDNPVELLRRFKKFMAPQGRCFVTVPNAESLHRRFGHEAGLLSNMASLGEGDQALGHQRLYTVATMTQQLKICGYEVTRKEGIFLKPFTTRQLKSLNLSDAVLEGMCKVGIKYPELSAGLLFEAKIVM